MRARTPKRAKQEKEYADVCKELDDELDRQKKLYCFFCGKPLSENWIHHHLRGREGALLVDKDYLVVGCFECHRQYHDLPVRKQKWREIFMENLREKDPQTYYKEREKENK